MMAGFYIVVAHDNLIKKIVGLNVFQASVFILYITFGKVQGGTAPIIGEGFTTYSNPLPHVLILTAIVVGVATTAPRKKKRDRTPRCSSGCYTSPLCTDLYAGTLP